MQYDELIIQCIKALKEFNPKIEGPNSFIERFLKYVISSYNFFKIYFIGNQRNNQKNVYKTSILWCIKIH